MPGFAKKHPLPTCEQACFYFQSQKLAKQYVGITFILPTTSCVFVESSRRIWYGSFCKPQDLVAHFSRPSHHCFEAGTGFKAAFQAKAPARGSDRIMSWTEQKIQMLKDMWG